MTAPVTRHARRLVAENSKFHVYFDRVSNGAGVEVPDYLVVRSKTVREDQISGVTIIPVWQGRVVLIRSYRHPVDRWVWEAPRGFVDANEDTEAAAIRELEEETGLRVRPENLIALGCCAPETSTIIGRGACFAALDCERGGERDGEELGLGDTHAFSLDEALDMADRSEIEDATTLAALYRYARRAGRER